MLTRSEIVQIEKNNTELWRERIRTGATILDQRMPGWESRINLCALNQRWQDSDILGQLYPGYHRTAILSFLFSRFERINGSESPYRIEAELHGFSGCPIRQEHWIDDDLLTSLWVEHLMIRAYYE